MEKQSKASKIRALLAEGLSVKEIANKLNYTEAYVAQTKWHWKKTAKQNVEKKAKKAKVIKAATKLFDKEYKKYKTKNKNKLDVKYGKSKKLINVVKDMDGILDFLRTEDNLLTEKNDDTAAMGIGWHVADRQERVDVVNSPSHYKKGGIECIDAIRSALTEDEFRGFCKGTALAYIWRLGHKDAAEIDAAKTEWYVSWLKGVDPRVMGIDLSQKSAW